jgi:hypothetical protein
MSLKELNEVGRLQPLDSPRSGSTSEPPAERSKTFGFTGV